MSLFSLRTSDSYVRLLRHEVEQRVQPKCAVRLDVVSLLVLNDSRRIIRHYRNALSESA